MDNKKSTVEENILRLLKASQEMTTREISNSLPDIEYNTVKMAVNRLKRNGVIDVTVKKDNKDYYGIKGSQTKRDSDPLKAALNTTAPKSPDKIEPMSDDEWNREVGKVEANRPWTHLSFQEIFRLAEDVYDDICSWEVIGKAVFLYAKFMVENNKSPNMDDVLAVMPDDPNSKDILRAVKHLINYPFVITNEEYAYNVIVNNWRRGKGDRAKLNPHFKEMENRIKGIPLDNRSITAR